MHRPILLLLSLLGLCCLADPPHPLTPLQRAHAHNDYLHAHPLLDALDHGFCSVEADVCLVAGQLLVAHDADKTQPARTLSALYLDPLRARVQANAGRVFPDGPAFTLWIDIKTDAEPAYAALRDLLKPYRPMLTAFHDGKVRPGAVTVIISGNRPRALLAAEKSRWVFYDGRPEDLGQGAPAHFMPVISARWDTLFKWNGAGPMPAAQRTALQQFVERAHREGKKVRFWATPEIPAIWRELLTAGVDLINTDRLELLQQFLLSNPQPARP